MNTKRNIIGARLRRIRIANDLSQKQLAIYLQLSGSELDRAQIAKIEAGIRKIGDLELWYLSLVLRVGVERFFEGLEAESTEKHFKNQA